MGTDSAESKTRRDGLWLALTAYITWGVVPVYFKWIGVIPPFEIVAHRLIWSLVFLLGLLTLTGRWKDMYLSWRRIRFLIPSALMLAANWLIFIWAISNDNITESSLGYFINPLVSVFFGMVFLGERLRPLQWIALFIASAGIAWQLLYFGEIPWIALSLAICFGFYGLLRKQLDMPSFAGLTMECLILLPAAIAYLIWLGFEEKITMGTMGIGIDILLMVSGIVTALPLLCFAAAVTRLPLVTIGIVQYVSPSVSLIIAVFVYNEPFGLSRIITFTCIWVALIIFTAESVLKQRKTDARSG